MIISPDRTKVFIAVTKTGSTTAEYLLSQIPGVIVLNEQSIKHGCRSDLHREIIEGNPLLDGLGLDAWNMTAYAYVRNPLNRFFSSCNYLKRFPYALTKLFPDKFTVEQMEIATDDFKRKFTLAEWLGLPLLVRNRIRNLTPEDFLSVEDRLGFAFRQQVWWHQQGIEQVLNFDNFESETRRLLADFGGDPTVNIPKINAADDFPTAVAYAANPDIAAAIHHRYWDDFRLCEQYGVET